MASISNTVVITSMQVIRAYGRSKQLRKVDECLGMMRRMRIQPNADIFAELIACAGDSHVPNKIPSLFRQMVDSYQVQPNMAVFEAAICSYGKCNQWRRALNCWNEMSMNDFSKSQQSYNYILDACMRDFVFVGVSTGHSRGWEAELILTALRSSQFKSARQITASMISDDVFRSLCTRSFELNLLGMSPGSACLALHWCAYLLIVLFTTLFLMETNVYCF
jgi:pentatricopeptide repeat protein